MSVALATRGRNGAAWAVAGIGIAVLCGVFFAEIRAAVVVWGSSTAYGHCWLVLPIAGWLLWERRAVLTSAAARPDARMALFAIPFALAWALADWLGIMEGRQLALVGFVLVVLLAVLGFRLWWALSAAFLYLVFLVPFGAFLTPALQHFTASFIGAGLRVLDIPFEADAFKITIPEGVFYVAEACAGLRFLIASVAFGVLYAVTMFRSPGRRAAFIALCCIVPVVANGFRGLGIVLLGHVLGSAQAGAADHLLYGWVFFSLVIIALALAGLPFRQDAVSAAAVPPRPAPSRPATTAIACAAVVLVALSGPLLAGVGQAGGTPASVHRAPYPAPAGCTARTSQDGFQCGRYHLRVVRAALARGSDPARILDTARAGAMLGLGGDLDTEKWPAPAPWMLVRARDTGRIAAYSVVVDGVQGTGGLHDRLRMLGDRLTSGDAPLAVSVTIEPGGPEAEIALKAFLAAAR